MSDWNEENEEDIILADLSDEELVEQMADDLYDGLKEMTYMMVLRKK